MLSPRYALPVILCFALALVPTIIHSYIGLRVDDGKTTLTVPDTLDSYTSRPTGLKTQLVKEVFDTEDWIDRIYSSPDGNQVRLFVANSYDHKRLYHHPELALSYGQDLDGAQAVTIPGNPTIPMFIFKNEGKSEWVSYAMLYDGKFVTNPVQHQLRDAIYSFVGGRKKLTLFYASGTKAFKGEPFEKSSVIHLLRLAIESFQNPEQTSTERQIAG